jgi:hypothetical protein
MDPASTALVTDFYRREREEFRAVDAVVAMTMIDW